MKENKVYSARMH